MAKHIDFERRAIKGRGILKEDEQTSCIAAEIEEYDIIALTKERFFYVFEVDREFKNPDVALLYEDNEDDILPEHEHINIWDEEGNSITCIHGDTPVVIYRKVEK